MKKAKRKPSDDMRPEYDFASMKGGVRGKYYKRLTEGVRSSPNRFASRLRRSVITVILEPDVAEIFDSSQSVNHALRSVIDAIPKRNQQPTSRKPRRKVS